MRLPRRRDSGPPHRESDWTTAQGTAHAGKTVIIHRVGTGKFFWSAFWRMLTVATSSKCWPQQAWSTVSLVLDPQCGATGVGIVGSDSRGKADRTGQWDLAIYWYTMLPPSRDPCTCTMCTWHWPHKVACIRTLWRSTKIKFPFYNCLI